ncbi:CCHC-type domain-containing protein [Citrus sinensis]|uniref:CCHC-type domain-containing protein n=1 Tax=Citrus sinensis TaxID=2711 RepID=A0ACB8ILF2_CITSI|nr:CCHC-type domain-containing protein [Citrus sinensis]
MLGREQEFEINTGYTHISLEEEEEGGLIVKGDDVNERGPGTIDSRFCLVGRFLTDKVISFPAMKNTMASLWRPVKGVCIKDLSPTLFLFQFFHEVDVKRVLESGPWTFDQHILILKRLKENEQPQNVLLCFTSFWIQVYNLPIGFMSEKILKDIGNYIGTFLESDAHKLMGVWRNYMRIRVSIDVRKPLKRRMKMKKAGGDWIWVDFKYERLNIFCFICGLLGHTEKQCPKLYDCPPGEIVKCYGHWLKAPNRRNAMNSGERWLRSVPPGEDDKEKGRSEDAVVTMVIDSVLATNQGDSIRRNIDGNENVGIMVASKKGDILLPTRTPPTVKGKQVKGTTNVIDFNENSGDEMVEGLIVNDAKRRRSLVVSCSKVGFEGEVTSQSMLLESISKNIPAVGPVDQAHRDQ